jgi:hypothetical protein
MMARGSPSPARNPEMSESAKDLADLGRTYADLLFSVFERLCADDDKAIANDDLVQLQKWHANKVAAMELEFRAKGLADDAISVWRAAYRNQFASKGGEFGRDNFRDQG